MSEGVIGLGPLLTIGDRDTPEVFTTIAEVKDITGPGLTREFAEFKHPQSASGYREYKPTFKNSGNVTFKCNFLPDDSTQGFAATGKLKDSEDGQLRSFQLLFPDAGATFASFAAYVANIQPTAPRWFGARTQRDASHHRAGDLELEMTQLTPEQILAADARLPDQGVYISQYYRDCCRVRTSAQFQIDRVSRFCVFLRVLRL